jgi:glycosyltransferase involved in cell wall biosynthesis
MAEPHSRLPRGAALPSAEQAGRDDSTPDFAGAIPEMIVDGRTGFVVKDEDEMPRALDRIGKLDRSACRRHVAEGFSLERVVAASEDAFRRVL